MFLVLQLYFNFAHNVYCVISYLYVSVRCVIDCNKLLLSIYINVYLKLCVRYWTDFLVIMSIP